MSSSVSRPKRLAGSGRSAQTLGLITGVCSVRPPFSPDPTCVVRLSSVIASRTRAIPLRDGSRGQESPFPACVFGALQHPLHVTFEKEHYPDLPGVARTLTYPPSFSETIRLRVARANEAAARAIGIPFGITHAEFIVDGDVRGLLSDTARVRKLRLEGFEINVPPKAEKKENASPTRTTIPELIIDEMHADGTVLRIYSRT